MLGIGLDISRVKLPIIQLSCEPLTTTTENWDTAQINPSSILAYLGIRGIGQSNTIQSRNFNGVPLLAYWDIYKNYYANKQEEKGAVITQPSQPSERMVVTKVRIFETNGTEADIGYIDSTVDAIRLEQISKQGGWIYSNRITVQIAPGEEFNPDLLMLYGRPPGQP